MNINSNGPNAHKRARTLVLRAESDIEAALLHQLMLKLRETPLSLGRWQLDVLRAVDELGAASTNEVADRLDESVTAINNRMTALWKMGLLSREADNVMPGGRRFVYRIKTVEAFLQENGEENQT